MIRAFIDPFIKRKHTLFLNQHPTSYNDILKTSIETFNPYGEILTLPDPNRIHCINDGEYSGTLIFLVAESGYQPSIYWATKVNYGSCSGCDTLCGIRGNSYTPTKQQSEDYQTLALHIVQRLTQI